MKTLIFLIILFSSSVATAQRIGPYRTGYVYPYRTGSTSAYSDRFGYRVPRSPYNFGRNYRGYSQGYRALYGNRPIYLQIPQSPYNFGRNQRGYGQGYKYLRSQGKR
jgi:hypothetical protein